jgi:hypothetical protein
MGVAVDELLVDTARDGLQVEGACFGTDLGVEDDLEEKVAKLPAEGVEVAPVKSLDDFVCLLEQVRSQGPVGLLGIPGAAPGCTQPGHDVHKAIDFIHRYRVRTGRRPRSVAACNPVIGYQT